MVLQELCILLLILLLYNIYEHICALVIGAKSSVRERRASLVYLHSDHAKKKSVVFIVEISCQIYRIP